GETGTDTSTRKGLVSSRLRSRVTSKAARGRSQRRKPGHPQPAVPKWTWARSCGACGADRYARGQWPITAALALKTSMLVRLPTGHGATFGLHTVGQVGAVPCVSPCNR